MDAKTVDRTPNALTRSRQVALGFALLTQLTSLAQIDHHLPVWRIILAAVADVILVTQSLYAYRRQRVGWTITLLAAPLVVASAQGLIIQPAAIPLAMGVMVMQSLYVSRRQTLAGIGGVSAAVPLLGVTLVFLHPEKPIDVGVLIIPMPLLLALNLLVRTLYQTLRKQQAALDREALLAGTSRAMLGVTDLTAVMTISVDSLTKMCDLVPGLSITLLHQHGDRIDTELALGADAATVPPSRPVARVASLFTDHPTGRLVPVPPSEVEAFAGPGAQVVPHTIRLVGDSHRFLLVGSRAALPTGLDVVLETLIAQISLAAATCRSHAELITLAHHDTLTSLANRAAFFASLSQAVDGSLGRERRVSLLVIDLDDFKIINDTSGHAAGDQVLIEVADRMQMTVDSQLEPAGGIAARFGGDEFAVLLTDVEPEVLLPIAEHLCRRLTAPIEWEGENLQVGASIGLASGAVGMTAGDLMRCADIAMYSAKALGKNQVVHFREEEHGSVAQRRRLDAHLLEAATRQEITLTYQPIMDLMTDGCVGVEASALWNHPTEGVIPPSVFIPIAERQGIIDDLGRHILTTACAEVMAWADSPQLKLSMHISARQLSRPDFAVLVRDALDDSGLPADRLVLDFTESHLLMDQAMVERLRILHRLGIGLSLTDFGSGSTSLASLRASSVDQLKLDRRLLGDSGGDSGGDSAGDSGGDSAGDSGGDALIGMIMAISELVGLHVVAQAVDTPEHLSWARDHEIRFAQGAAIVGALPPAQAAAWIAQRTPQEAAAPVGASRAAHRA